MSHLPIESERCQFTYASGRFCRMLRVAPGEPYCYHHWERQQQEDAAVKAAAQITGSFASIKTRDGILEALCNIFQLLAQNRISPRNAAALGYLAQLMLPHLPARECTSEPMKLLEPQDSAGAESPEARFSEKVPA